MIKLPTQIGTSDIPEVFGNFEHLVVAKHWTRRAEQLREEIKGNPFLSDYLLDENLMIGTSACSPLAIGRTCSGRQVRIGVPKIKRRQARSSL